MTRMRRMMKTMRRLSLKISMKMMRKEKMRIVMLRPCKERMTATMKKTQMRRDPLWTRSSSAWTATGRAFSTSLSSFW